MVDVAPLGTVLGVWAHPDDDIYLSAGLMALGVERGDRVVDVTATRGEGGSLDEQRWPPSSMAEVRTRELLRSLEILGVTEHRFLDGPVDVDMETPLDDAGADQVREIVADVRPDSILTFAPDGMTGHEGHKSVCRWATRAFHDAAPDGARLYYATATPDWVERWERQLEPFDIFLPGYPVTTPRDELAIGFELPPEVLDRKVDAIQAHESQVQGLVEVFGDRMREWMAEETFRLAAVKGA
ncbi:MAG TPA: PIG-L deacetylase family protein [Actinomycetota bacterium]|nr:PIG-L deacetylase family protein [Actinomycetota bacterium]